MITTDPKILVMAFVGGMIPALMWLWFWRKEDSRNTEPKALMTIIFLIGMLTVLVTLPAQKIVQGLALPHIWQIISYAGVEELLKFIMVVLIISNTNQVDEPTDWPIYFITIAVGFAGLENALFLLKPLSLGQTSVGLMTGELRFLGSTLLHTIASGMIGISMGLSFFMGRFTKIIYVFFGIIGAITLHSAYNFFIIQDNGNNFLQVFGFLWVGAIMVMLIFEKLRRMNLLVNQQ